MNSLKLIQEDTDAVYMFISFMFDELESSTSTTTYSDVNAFHNKYLISVAKYMFWHIKGVPRHITNNSASFLRKLMKKNPDISEDQLLIALMRRLKHMKQITNKLKYAFTTNNWNISFKKRRPEDCLNIMESLQPQKHSLVHFG